MEATERSALRTTVGKNWNVEDQKLLTRYLSLLLPVLPNAALKQAFNTSTQLQVAESTCTVGGEAFPIVFQSCELAQISFSHQPIHPEMEMSQGHRHIVGKRVFQGN